MEAREAYERRAARLALLLTDDAARSGAALSAVFRAHPDLSRVGETMLERTVVQACRSQGRGSGGIAPPGMDDRAAALLAAARSLEHQPWEAWVLREVEGQDEILTARAMDCSKTAIEQVHLAPAVAQVRARIAPASYEDALVALRASLERVDIGPVLAMGHEARERALRRSRMVSALQLLVLAACFGLMTFVLFDLLRAAEEERMGPGIEERYSNPMPEGDAAGDAP